MSRRVTVPALSRRGGNDALVICDSLADYVDTAERTIPKHRREDTSWAGGGKTFATVVNNARHGDLSLVAPSDKLLNELESKVRFISSSWKTVGAVCGGAVNAGAFAAGIPLCMRQRKRMSSAMAPLSVVVDLTVSGGLDDGQIARRGSALLALVRLLTGIRPTDLYLAVCMQGTGGHASTAVLVPFETKPLELATAANALCSTGFVRMLGYGTCDAHVETTGLWPGDGIKEYRSIGRSYWDRFCGHAGGELLFVPPAHVEDKLLSSPVDWLQEKLTEYGGVATEE